MMQPALKVGITTPWDLASLSPDEQRSRLDSIADAGIDHVFTADHVSFHDDSGIDGPVRLAALGGMESRLDLYLGVYLLALRHPLVAARQIATLAELAPGRLTVGIGVGGEDRHEIEVCGVDPKTRGRRTDAALAALRRLLDGETVDGDGEFFDFKDGRILPTPTPRVPLIVGGRSNAALERAGRFGDDYLRPFVEAGATTLNLTPCGASPELEIEAVAQVKEHLSQPVDLSPKPLERGHTKCSCTTQ